MGKHLGTQKSIRFSDEELQLLDALQERYGSYKAAIMAGLKMLHGVDRPDWPAELRRLADELERSGA